MTTVTTAPASTCPKPLPPCFPYFGGKHKYSARYPRPLHQTIIEPFAGSAGYSHRYWWHEIMLVEKDTRLVDLWRYLIAATRHDILALPVLKSGDDIRDFKYLSYEERLLLSYWVGVGAAPANKVTYWGASRQASVGRRQRLADNVHKVDHWQIIEGDYSDVRDRRATWFIDPPYAEMGHRYRHSNIDYHELAQWCLIREGQVIVCENNDADWLPFSPLYEMSGMKSRTGRRKKSVEAVWCDQGM